MDDLEWRATSVCGVLWILARQLDCNTFFLSVCVRSSELQCGVHFSVSTSPRVILVGTVVRAAASFVCKVCIDSAETASNSDVAAAVWVAGYHPRRPSQVVSELNRGTTSTRDELCRGVEGRKED